MSRYQKGKTNLDFTEARDSEWQWPRLGHMQVCTSLQTDNHASTPPLSAMRNTVTGKESEDAVAGGIHVEALAGVRTVDASAGYLLTAVTVVRAQMRVGEVAALVVVVTHAQFLQLREVDVQRTAAVVHVLAVQRLSTNRSCCWAPLKLLLLPYARNSLPNAIRRSSSLVIFKRSPITYFYTQCFY